MNKYDLGIIGAGPAGYTAALCAAKIGQKVVLFEKNEIGGTCLNRGCIPTKSILKSSYVYKTLQNAQDFGVYAENITFDYKKILEQKDKIVQTLRKNIEHELKCAKVDVVRCRAKIVSANEISSDNGDIFECKKIICATGSTPRQLKGFEFDGEYILSSDDILDLTELPKSILIVGSGAIGIEWARIFSNFGVETTLIELAPNLLPLADIDISKRLEREFKSSGIKFFKETSIKRIENDKVFLSNDNEISAEKVLVSIGRVPNLINRIDGVDYIGDVSGEIQLAHYATHQAFEYLTNIPMRKDLIPSVIYGDLEIAWIGKKEQDLKNEDYQKSTVLFSSLGKSWCDRQTDGIIKIISQNNKIVGAHIIGKEASSLIAQLTIAIQNEISIEKLKQTCFAHPTYCEGIFDAIMKL